MGLQAHGETAPVDFGLVPPDHAGRRSARHRVGGAESAFELIHEFDAKGTADNRRRGNGAHALRSHRGPARGVRIFRSPSLVSIVKAPGYTKDVYDIVFRLVAAHKPDVRGKRIVLKPNLVEFDPATADQHSSGRRACRV